VLKTEDLVSSIECISYDQEKVYSSVKEALVQIGFELPEGKTVLIKPNIMTQNRPEQNSITHYTVVDALCRLLKEKNCRIQIGESIAFYQKGLTRKAFEKSGIQKIAAEYDALLLPFEESPLIKVPSPASKIKELYIPQCLLEADMIINACKLKTHGGLRLSGALKNMFGCLPGGYKQRIHQWCRNDYELSDVFLDIHEILRPALSVMDGVISLDGGPSAIGKPVMTSRILASSSAAALDLAACRILGYAPEEIPTLIQAKNRKWISSYEDFKVLGDLPSVKFRFLVKGKIPESYEKPGLFVTHTYVTPDIRSSRCNCCGDCLEVCPVQAILPGDQHPVIDTKLCINCYHCLSICPRGAIIIKSSAANKFIRLVRRIVGI